MPCYAMPNMLSVQKQRIQAEVSERRLEFIKSMRLTMIVWGIVKLEFPRETEQERIHTQKHRKHLFFFSSSFPLCLSFLPFFPSVGRF